jgi:hypothetical protein
VTSSGRALVSALAAMLAAVALAGCGVGLQQTAEPLPSNIIPAPIPVVTASPTPEATPAPSTSSPSNSAQLRVWFVQEDGLAAVETSLPEGTSPEIVLQALAAGPNEQQLAEGLRTVAQDPVTGLALVSIAPSAAPTSTPASSGPAASGSPDYDGVVVPVMLSAAFSALPPAEQVLLLGQVVLSLTGSGASFVSFQDEAGSPVAVPLPDGRLLDTPATARDYGILIIRP